MKANKYDLSASRYRQIEKDEEFYEEPQLTHQRRRLLEAVATSEIMALEALIAAAAK